MDLFTARVDAAAKAICKDTLSADSDHYDQMSEADKDTWRSIARKALVAADAVTPDDHVDQPLVDEMLRQAGNQPN